MTKVEDMGQSRVRWFVVGVASTIALAGCGSGEGAETETELRSQLSTDPSTFDPARSAGGDDYNVARLLFDSPLRLGPDGIEAGLATSWEAESASSYTLTIRDDATCVDGTEITASVVADSLEYLASPDTASNFRGLVFGSGDVVITADDDAAEVAIELSEPYANLPQGLTLAQSGIICPAGLADPEGLARGDVPEAFSGPYELGAAKPGLEYRFDLRDGYEAWPEFAADLPGNAPEAITFGLVTDASATANQLLSGDLDFAYVQGEAADRFDGQDEYRSLPTTVASIYLVFNQADGRVFSDPDLRLAVAQAVDAEAFVSAFSGGRGEVFDTLVPPDYRCALADPSLRVDQDAQAAAALLDGVSATVLGSNAFGDNGAGNEYIAEALGAAGADIDLINADNATWATTMNQPGSDWDVVVMGDINATQQVSASLNRVMGPSIAEGGRNVGSADNPEGLAQLTEALVQTDPDAQCAAYEQAQRSVLERHDIVPLTGLITTMVSGENVEMQAIGDYLDFATVRVGVA